MKDKKYTLGKNLLFHLKSAKNWNRWVCYFQFLEVIPSVIATFIGIYLPSMIVGQLEKKVPLKNLLISIVVCSVTMLLCNVIDNTMWQYLYRNGLSLVMYYDKLAFEKTMKIDYDLLESKEVQKLVGNVWGTLRNEFAIRNSVTAMPVLLISLINTVFYGAMLFQFSYLIFFALVFSALCHSIFLKKTRQVHKKNHEELSRYTKEISYINRHAMERTDGKDIRIYQMQEWFLEKYDYAISNIDRIFGKIHTQYFLRRLKSSGIGYLIELFCYLWLAYALVDGKMGISYSIFAIGFVNTFSSSLGNFTYHVQNLNNINAFLTYMRKLLSLPEKEKKEKKNVDKTNGIEIRFDHVSFQYPQAQKEVLHDINLTIHANEKIALIGLNGAGKTTLAKLICGFYKPTKGTIFVNGIPQNEYDTEEYISLISALFQDSMLFPVNVDENLTGYVTEEIDENKLQYVLKMSGFEEKYKTLEQRGKTRLVREVHKEAIDLSGGEKQKLLFARALYKEAPFMILDEPTAALDPIAENELYLRYAEVTKNRTVLFISHRLSSTRFCDRIILLENARILEEGTHETLLKQGGRYASLFEMQSKYYKEGEVS